MKGGTNAAKVTWSWSEQLLHAPDTHVRVLPALSARVSKAIADATGVTRVTHTEVVFELKDARVTVNVHVERK